MYDITGNFGNNMTYTKTNIDNLSGKALNMSGDLDDIKSIINNIYNTVFDGNQKTENIFQNI